MTEGWRVATAAELTLPPALPGRGEAGFVAGPETWASAAGPPGHPVGCHCERRLLRQRGLAPGRASAGQPAALRRQRAVLSRALQETRSQRMSHPVPRPGDAEPRGEGPGPRWPQAAAVPAPVVREDWCLGQRSPGATRGRGLRAEAGLGLPRTGLFPNLTFDILKRHTRVEGAVRESPRPPDASTHPPVACLALPASSPCPQRAGRLCQSERGVGSLSCEFKE